MIHKHYFSLNSQISFDLPYDYQIIENYGNAGEIEYSLVSGAHIDENGEDAYNFHARIQICECEMDCTDYGPVPGIGWLDALQDKNPENRYYRISSAFHHAQFQTQKTPLNLGGTIMKLYGLMLLVPFTSKSAVVMTIVTSLSDNYSENLEAYESFLQAANTIRINGEKLHFENLTARTLMSELLPTFSESEEGIVNLRMGVKINGEDAGMITYNKDGTTSSEVFGADTEESEEEIVNYIQDGIEDLKNRLKSLSEQLGIDLDEDDTEEDDDEEEDDNWLWSPSDDEDDEDEDDGEDDEDDEDEYSQPQSSTSAHNSSEAVSNGIPASEKDLIYVTKDGWTVFKNSWRMYLPLGCRILIDPADDSDEDEESGALSLHCTIKNSTSALWGFSLFSDSFVQGLHSAAEGFSFVNVFHESEAVLLKDTIIRDDDIFKVVLLLALNENDSCGARLEIKHKPTDERYLFTALLPQVYDLQSAVKNLNECFYNPDGHPFGRRWLNIWNLLIRIACSICDEGEFSELHEAWMLYAKQLPMESISALPNGFNAYVPKGLYHFPASGDQLECYVLSDKTPSRESASDLDMNKMLIIRSEHTMDLNGGPEVPLLFQRDVMSRSTACMTGKVSVILMEESNDLYHKCISVDLFNGTAASVVNIMTSDGKLLNFRVVSQTDNDVGVSVFEILKYAYAIYQNLFITGNTGACCYSYIFPKVPDYLHEHHDLICGSAFGGYTSRSGADFVGQSIRQLMEDNRNYDSDILDLLETAQPWNMDQTALEFAKVFRLNENLFDPYSDPEAMIHKGMFADARMFSALRSLAWTLAEDAKNRRRDISDYCFEELSALGEFIKERNFLNYDISSWFPGLCDHYDWRVFYVPDYYLENEPDDDLRYLCGKTERSGNTVSFFMPGGDLSDFHRRNQMISRNEETLESLEALRDDLANLKPVMQVIHDGLMQNRDRSQALAGPLADALNAWCALCVAAREAFYSEEANRDNGLSVSLERPYSFSGNPVAAQAKKAPLAFEGTILDLGGKTVIEAGQFATDMTLKNIIIPEGVTEIGPQAFYQCMMLESVAFPASLKKIGDSAFMGCRALRSVMLQEGVEEMENFVFGACSSLLKVEFPESLQKVYRCVFGLGGDSPYATAYMSGTVARRLGDVYARHLVIDGKGYDTIAEYLASDAKNISSYEEKRASEDFVRSYREYISENPQIEFEGKLFAFTGFGGSSDKEHPLVQQVMARGGLHRKNISGKTDYLVVDPIEAGEAKLRAAIEQIKNGGHIQIVLKGDLEKALCEEATVSKATDLPAKEKAVAESLKAVDISVGNSSTKASLPSEDDFRIPKSPERATESVRSEADPEDELLQIIAEEESSSTSIFNWPTAESVAEKADSEEADKPKNETGVPSEVDEEKVIPTIDSLYKRAQIFLEDGDFEQADVYFNRILDIDPEYAPAYIGLLCVKKRLQHEGALANLEAPIEDETLYIRAMKYGTAGQCRLYMGYNNTIKNRIQEAVNKERIAREEQRRELEAHHLRKYNLARSMMNANNIASHSSALSIFKELSGFRDSDELAVQCKSTLEKLYQEKNAQKEETLRREQNAEKRTKLVIVGVIILLGLFLVYMTVVRPKLVYQSGVKKMENGEYTEAIDIFRTLPLSRSKSAILKCTGQYIQQLTDDGEYNSAIFYMNEFAQTGGSSTDSAYYYRSMIRTMMDRNNEALAIKYLDGHNSFIPSEEAQKLKNECHYLLGEDALSAENYDEAVNQFLLAGDYSDAQEKVKELQGDGVDETTTPSEPATENISDTEEETDTAVDDYFLSDVSTAEFEYKKGNTIDWRTDIWNNDWVVSQDSLYALRIDAIEFTADANIIYYASIAKYNADDAQFYIQDTEVKTTCPLASVMYSDQLKVIAYAKAKSFVGSAGNYKATLPCQIDLGSIKVDFSISIDYKMY